LLGFLSRWSTDVSVMIKSIVNEHHWSPNIIDNMYCDDIDHNGIEYWYNNLKEMHEKLDGSDN